MMSWNSDVRPRDEAYPTQGILLIYLIGVWLAAHWYQGIGHDARLYVGQAIARLSPEAFRNDLFFAFGSQDDFTLFTPFFSWLIQHLDITEAGMILVAGAHALWLAMIALIAARSLSAPTSWAALVIACGTTGFYGPERILAYGEGFPTARVWAEALGLAGIAATLYGHRWTALALAIAGAAMHPIIGLAALLFVVFHGCTLRQALGVAAFAAAAGAVASVTEFVPLSRVLLVMDDAWYALVLDRAPYVMIHEWKTADLNEAACLFAVLLAALAVGEGDLRRICRAALLTGAVGIALALLASLTHYALLVQMQPWRVLWLLRIIATLAAVWLLSTCWSGGGARRLLLVWLAIGWLATPYWGGLMASGAALGFAYFRNRPEPRASRLVGFATGIAFALVAVYAFVAQVQQAAVEMARNEAVATAENLNVWNAYGLIALFGAGVFLPLLFALWQLARKSAAGRWVALAGATLFSILAASHWDQRTLHEKDLLSALWRDSDPLASHLPKTALVYWESAPFYSWAFLRQGNYASRQQATGALYSRDAALESRRRLARLERLGVQDSDVRWRPARTSGAPAAEVTFAGLVHVCHDPVLDYAILQDNLGHGVARSFPWPWGGTRHIYDCARLRREFPDPFPDGLTAAGTVRR